MLSGIVKFLLTIVLIVVLTFSIGFLFQGDDFLLYRFFAPREEAARRSVFEESKAYRDGMVQELDAMRFQYLQADVDHQAALGSVFLHRAESYGIDRLPNDLRDFAVMLRARQGKASGDRTQGDRP